MVMKLHGSEDHAALIMVDTIDMYHMLSYCCDLDVMVGDTLHIGNIIDMFHQYCFKVRSGLSSIAFIGRTVNRTGSRRLQNARNADRDHKKPQKTGCNQSRNEYNKTCARLAKVGHVL